MVGKQGFIRTMEAVIAILLVLGFLLYVLPRKPVLAESIIPEGLDSSRNFILTEFSTNKTVRECVDLASVSEQLLDSNRCTKANYGTDEKCKEIIESLLTKHTIPGFDYVCEICPGVKPCIQLPGVTMKKSIYPGSVFIYLSPEEVKYVRIYFWRK